MQHKKLFQIIAFSAAAIALIYCAVFLMTKRNAIFAHEIAQQFCKYEEMSLRESKKALEEKLAKLLENEDKNIIAIDEALLYLKINEKIGKELAKSCSAESKYFRENIKALTIAKLEEAIANSLAMVYATEWNRALSFISSVSLRKKLYESGNFRSSEKTTVEQNLPAITKNLKKMCSYSADIRLPSQLQKDALFAFQYKRIKHRVLEKCNQMMKELVLEVSECAESEDKYIRAFCREKLKIIANFKMKSDINE